MIRKAAKKDYDSGDYSSCGTVEEVATAGGIVYSAYENDGKVYRGEWSDSSCSYSISYTEPVLLSQA